MTDETIRRFTYVERIVHWAIGTSFVVLLLTGLAFSYPALFWITTLVGGGANARLLHPWVGAIFTIALVAMFAVWLRDMVMDADDWAWLRAVRHYAARRHEHVPAAGKYNAGQKAFFWLQSVIGLVLVVSGVPLWFPEGMLGVTFDPSLLQVMRVLHYVGGLGGGLLLIVHVYLGTAAYPGTARGMIDGRVTRRWARHHHPRWDGPGGP